MAEMTYTKDQLNDAKRVSEIVASVPQEKRFLVTVATEAFINGMIAQERLTGQTERTGARRGKQHEQRKVSL